MNEQETKHKHVLPFIKKQLGYSDDHIEHEKRIKVGRNSYVYADIVTYVDDRETVAFVLETKKPSTYLPDYKDQVISYGLLLRSPYSVLCDGFKIIIYDTKTKDEIYNDKMIGAKRHLSKTTLSRKKKVLGALSESEERKAKETLNRFERLENFILVLEKCENLIRDIDGKTGEDAFGELSKMLFIKIFSEKEGLEDTFSSQGETGIRVIFDQAKGKYPDLFKQDEIISLKPHTLDGLIEELKKHSFTHTDIDIKGKAFEIFIGNTLTGKLGQFFTPRTVVNFMVSFLPPKYKKADGSAAKIIDPSCGSGGFLIEILKNLFDSIERKEQQRNITRAKEQVIKKQIYGVDVSPNLVRTAKMNMVLHGDGSGGIIRGNGLLLIHEEHKNFAKNFDYIYTNPPFGSKDNNKEILERYPNVAANKKEADREVLFIEQYTNLLSEGGFLSVVLPNGMLNNAQTQGIRNYIFNQYIIIAVIGLPDKSFKSSVANSHTSVLFLKKKVGEEKQPPIFMAVAKEIGFERKTKNAMTIHQNDLEKILDSYKHYKVNGEVKKNEVEKLDELSFIVPNQKMESRLDANYYYAKYMIDVGDSQKLGDICSISEEKIQDESKIFKYVQLSDVSESIGGIVSYTKKGIKEELPDRAKMLINKHDIICARVFDSEKNVAIVDVDFSGEVASTGFIVLRATKKEIPYQLLYYYMHLETTLQQVRYLCSGTILPACRNENFMQIRIPKIKNTKLKEKIIDRVKKLEKTRVELQQGLKALSDL